MKSSIIIHGKNPLSIKDMDRIAEFYGFKKWSLTALSTISREKRHGWLIFQIVKFEGKPDLEWMTIESAVDVYNKAIPLTEWAEGNPPSIGEYIASPHNNRMMRRWFDGNVWSLPWFVGDNQARADSQAGQPRGSYLPMKWRGLSKPPIILKELK